ncbi:unnamed protein product [Linum trigynum]|uniref:Uncharacterized protein n=1 Tax=Linum trigynum TaxID=586398 RepID=A0AAV2GY77_9ROSI
MKDVKNSQKPRTRNEGGRTDLINLVGRNRNPKKEEPSRKSLLVYFQSDPTFLVMAATVTMAGGCRHLYRFPNAALSRFPCQL